jgi:ADP-ribose pyrophosphatase
MPDEARAPANPPLGETLESRRGYDGAWIHVRVDTVRLPSGRVTTRETVEHPGAVAIVGVTKDEQILLVRQSHHPIGRTLLGLPAGTLELGETPEACARRELEEETGYRAGRLTELAGFYTSPGYTNERMTVFQADDCEPAGGQLDPDELIHLAPTPIAELPALVDPGPGQIEDAKTLVGLLLFLRSRQSTK